MGRNYWMVVTSPEDYEITKEKGFTLLGFRPRYRRRAQRMQPDDRMLYYVTGIRKWTAITTITSQYFEDRTPVWKSTRRGDAYPFRIKTQPTIVLDEDDYIDALLLAPRLEYVKRWAPEDWPLAFFDSLHLIPQKDYRLIEGEMNRLLSKRKQNRPHRPWDKKNDNSENSQGQRNFNNEESVQEEEMSVVSDQSATGASSEGSK